MRKSLDYFGQAGDPTSGFDSVTDWSAGMQKGLTDLSRNAGMDINEIVAENPIGGQGIDSNGVMAQMNRRQQAISRRNALLARQTSDFRDAMGKSFDTWGGHSPNPHILVQPGQVNTMKGYTSDSISPDPSQWTRI
jgi:hypothetical protein